MGHRILLSTLFEMLQTMNLREVHNQTETGTELNNPKIGNGAERENLSYLTQF